MFREPALRDWAQFFALMAASAGMCSGFQNALYVMMGLNSWHYHFLHYALLWALTRGLIAAGLVPVKGVPWKDVAPAAASQVLVSVLTCLVNGSGNEGSLYTLRLFDWVTTAFVLVLARKFTDPTSEPAAERRRLVLGLGVAASLAWAEGGMVDASPLSLALAPAVGAANALHFLLVFRAQQRLACHSDELMTRLGGLTALGLFLPMALGTSDAFNKGQIGTASAWELVDYALVFMAVTFSTSLTYSKYWLMGNLSPESWTVLRQTMFTLAALGQWFVRNMGSATLFSFVAKAAALVAIALYAHRRARS